MLEQAAETFTALEDAGGLSWIAGTEGYVRLLQGQLVQARELAQSVLPLGEAAGERWGVAVLLTTVPLTFLGFLLATLAYQLADTYDHRYIYPMSFLIGFVVLAGAYFIMKNLFYAQGVVGIIIEAVGGITFLI